MTVFIKNPKRNLSTENKARSITDYFITQQRSNIITNNVRVNRRGICGARHRRLPTQSDKPDKNLPVDKEKRKKNIESKSKRKNTKYVLESLYDDSTVFLYKLGLAENMENETRRTIEQIRRTLKELKSLKIMNYLWKEELVNLMKEKKELHHKWLVTKILEDRQTCTRY